MKIIVSKRAQKEIIAAKKWYEETAEGLGFEFIGCLEARLGQIGRIPRGFQKVPETKLPNIHQVKTRRFPYYVIYQVREKEVLILSVFHVKRERDSW